MFTRNQKAKKERLLKRLGLMTSKLEEVSELSELMLFVGIVKWKNGDVWVYEHISGKGKHGKETIYFKSGDIINRFWRAGELLARRNVADKEAYFKKSG